MCRQRDFFDLENLVLQRDFCAKNRAMLRPIGTISGGCADRSLEVGSSGCFYYFFRLARLCLSRGSRIVREDNKDHYIASEDRQT